MNGATRVYFFATCIGNGVFADTCLNAVRLLQRAGVEVIYKKDQTCCGQPSFNSGYYEETRKIALHNIGLFDKDYPIILPSGSCTGVMRHDYIGLFKGTPYEQQVKDFASRVYELSEFLVDVLKVQYTDKGEKTRITWHSNCHALRVAKTIPHAKALLRQLNNVELVELEREEECCGFGGTFSIKEPEISNAMTEEKVLDIKNQNVDYLIAGDAGCLLNILGVMKKKGVDIKTMHLYDFLVQRIGV